MGKPHVAVLLPLQARAFRQPAEAVRQGFLAAAKAQADAPAYRIYPTSDEPAETVAAYRQAVEAGAQVIVGPLTKNAVTALAAQDVLAVPTLALSVPDTEIPPNEKLYLFGLSLDAEARQVARLMVRLGHRHALVIGNTGALSRRLQTQFAEAWREQRNPVPDILTPTPAAFVTLREHMLKQGVDAIFLALSATEARAVRPYLPASVPTYGTSQIFTGMREAQANVDLAGVRFVDMPWLIQPDHPAVMAYPRPETPLGADGERLYALGIDAFRLAQLLVRGPLPTRGVFLDGVTGALSLGPGQRVLRAPLAAEFQADVVVLLDGAAP